MGSYNQDFFYPAFLMIRCTHLALFPTMLMHCSVGQHPQPTLSPSNNMAVACIKASAPHFHPLSHTPNTHNFADLTRLKPVTQSPASTRRAPDHHTEDSDPSILQTHSISEPNIENAHPHTASTYSASRNHVTV